MRADPKAAAIDLMERWAQADRGRRGPSEIWIERVERIGPIQLSLGSVFEVRGFRFERVRLSPTQKGAGKTYDPWAYHFDLDPSGPLRVESKLVMHDQEQTVDCAPCDAIGRRRCSSCAGMQLTGLPRLGHGYRDAELLDQVEQAAEKLCREAFVPKGARLRHQRIEVREMPVYRVHYGKKEPLYVWGEPPMVSPAPPLLRYTERWLLLSLAVAIAAGTLALLLH